MREIRVPEDRIGVLIGENGETKRELEEVTNCELNIEGNVVRVEGETLDEMDAQKVVKAIGRGFNPEKALNIMEKDVSIHLIDINKYADTENSKERLKGRVIGKNGESRRHIEKMTETNISVYGKTVGIIGKMSNIEIAMEAIRMLLKGSSHNTAYTYIEKNQSKIKK